MPRRTARPQNFRTLTTLVARARAGDLQGLAAEVRTIARAVDMGEVVDVNMSAHGASTLVHMFAKIARELPDQALELNAILAACTRTMTEVTLTRANLRTAYRLLDRETGAVLPEGTSPSESVHTLQVPYIESAAKGERADAWMVLDSTGAVVGALYRWEGTNGGWSAYRMRPVDAMPADTSHLSDAQHRAWTHTIALEVETLAGIIARDNRGALVCSSGASGERSRAAAMTRAGWVLAG